MYRSCSLLEERQTYHSEQGNRAPDQAIDTVAKSSSDDDRGVGDDCAGYGTVCLSVL